MIRRLSFILLCFCIIFLGDSQIASACGCFPYSTVLEDFENSDLVLMARVVSLERAADPKPQPGGNLKSVTMVVEKVFKGALKVSEKLTFSQGEPILSCRWSFYEEMIGHQYLLYLYKPERSSDPWYISTCNRSADVEYAKDDLLYLNNMDKVRGRTRISGVLDEEGSEDVSLAGRKIRIIGGNKTYIATTDKNGVYELYDVPPGRYLLEPELRFGWKVYEFHITRQPKRSEMDRAACARVAFTLPPKKHFGINIRLSLSNHVSGAVYDSSGRPLKSVCVALVPANDERLLACNSLTDELGRFQIDSVAAGTYVIILNYENRITTSMPFPKLYYPGVADREKAKTITLKHGEIVNNLKVVITK